MWTTGSVAPPGTAESGKPEASHHRGTAILTPTLGPSIVLKGQISGREDLVIAGRVEGRIDVPDAAVTIAGEARVSAEISARTAVVMGTVAGDITATDKVEVRERGRVEGTIVSPRVVLLEGGHVNGKVVMPAPAARS